MVVVAIVALLAGVAMVVLMRARMITYETMGLATLRSYNKNLTMFSLVFQQYPADLTLTGPPNSNPPFLRPGEIGDGTTATRQGYTFVYARPDPASYTVNANPITHGVTATRHFLIDQTGQIHFTEANRDATTLDSLIP